MVLLQWESKVKLKKHRISYNDLNGECFAPLLCRSAKKSSPSPVHAFAVVPSLLVARLRHSRVTSCRGFYFECNTWHDSASMPAASSTEKSIAYCSHGPKKHLRWAENHLAHPQHTQCSQSTDVRMYGGMRDEQAEAERWTHTSTEFGGKVTRHKTESSMHTATRCQDGVEEQT